jgi:peptidoglycan/xylan/chitin deacetylase (PgdA/CDA1 family)
MMQRWLAPLRKAVPYACLPLAFPSYRLRPAIRILMYHRVARLGVYDQLTVTPEHFAEQMATLVSRCRVISLAQALSELGAGGPRTPAAVLTFDDGYRDNLVHALPVLRRHGLPATIFLTARFADGTLRHPRYPDEPGQLHLDWSEVVAMAAEPGITFGSHTLTHPFLTRVDEAEVAREIAGSRQEIAQRLGTEVEFFCYPSGDFTGRERALVAAAGYKGAVSVCPGVNRDIGERYALRRTEITDRDGPEELRLKLFGAFDLVHGLLHRRRERAFKRARAEAMAAVGTGSAA